VQIEWERGFNRAVENFQSGRWQEAVEEFLSLIAEAELAGKVFPEVLEALALVFTAQGKYEEAEKLFERICAFIDGSDGACPVRFVISLQSSQAKLYHRWGDYEKAVDLYERALRLVRQLQDNLPAETETWLQTEASLTCSLGDAFRCLGRFSEAEGLLRQSRILGQRIGSKEALESVEHNLALLYLSMGQAASAAEILHNLVEDVIPPHNDLPLMLANLSRANLRLGDYASAEKNLLQVVQNHLRILDRGSQAAVYNLLAEAYLHQRKYAQAEAITRKSLAVFDETVGLNHRLVAPALLNLACALQGQGLIDGVEALEQWAVSNVKERAGKVDRDLCRTIYQIAENHHARGQLGKSHLLYEDAIELYKEVFGADHPGLLGIRARLALSYVDNGKAANATTVLQEAIDSIEQVPDHMLEAESVDSLEILGDVSWRLQHYGAARLLYQRAGRLIAAACSQAEDCRSDELAARPASTNQPEQGFVAPMSGQSLVEGWLSNA
jgi:tetratricopeptide (TPR) repeat protein